MKIKLRIVYLVLPLIFVAAGCGPASKQTADNSKQEQKTSTTIEDIIKNGESYHCTFKMDPKEYGGLNGTVDIYADAKSEKIRTNMEAITGNTKNITSMISDKEYIYTWSGANAKTGMKTVNPKPVDANPSDTTKTSDTAKIDELKKNLDLKCNSWIVDDSMFALPANIKFTEIK